MSAIIRTLLLALVVLVMALTGPVALAGPAAASPAAPAPAGDAAVVAAAAVRTSSYAQTTDELNVRTGPSTRYAIVRVIPPGGRAWVLDGPYNTSWYRVSYAGATGYVHGGYLTAGAARSVTKLPTSSKVVALTFDAGSDTGYTAAILDTLRRENVQATFGMTGRWAQDNPGLMRRIVAEGHGLINHSWSHRSFTGLSTRSAPLSYAERVRELTSTQDAVRTIAGGQTLPLFRPPYGDVDASVLRDVWAQGYTTNVMWSVDSLGWRGLSRQQIVQRVLDGLQPGAIYLFHVGSASQDGPALPEMIAQLRARGYSFAPVGRYYR